MTNQTTTNEATGKTYSYDIHSTKIYGADKKLVKQLKTMLYLKSEYDVINMALEYFTQGHHTEIEALKKANEQQKIATSNIRKEVLYKLSQVQ